MTGARRHERDTTQRHSHTLLSAENSRGITRNVTRRRVHNVEIYIASVNGIDRKMIKK